MWPAPGKRMDDIGWKIRYSERITIGDRILAASIIDAYKQMIQDPQKNGTLLYLNYGKDRVRKRLTNQLNYSI